MAVALAGHPVARAEYRAYLRASGHANPPPLPQGERLSDPVTYVPQTDAAAFCQWLSIQEGRAYRLPRIAALQAQAGDASAEGVVL